MSNESFERIFPLMELLFEKSMRILTFPFVIVNPCNVTEDEDLLRRTTA